MSRPHLPFQVVPMTLADIPHITVIEQEAYAHTPSKKDYIYELEHNPLAHYYVLRIQHASPLQAVIGIGGCWLLANELHIITIAIHPSWQGLGLGEWLLLNLLQNGVRLKAQVATLEVRPTNAPAIALYKKYQFQQVGRRSGYYSDTGEDALIFTTPLLHSQSYQAWLARQEEQLIKRLAQIRIDKMA